MTRITCNCAEYELVAYVQHGALNPDDLVLTVQGPKRAADAMPNDLESEWLLVRFITSGTAPRMT